MLSTVKDKITNYFDGLTPEDIREAELIVKAIRIKTDAMIRWQVKKIKRMLNENSN